MSTPTEKELAGLLVGIISDGFNRALDALAKAGAIDTNKLHSQYKGVGSKYYDLVTEQIELTAKYGAAGILKRLSDESSQKERILTRPPETTRGM